jgi:hypothetical protein
VLISCCFLDRQSKFVTAPHRRRKSYTITRTNKDFDLDRIVSYDSTSSRRIVLPKKQNIEVPRFVDIGYRTDEQIRYASFSSSQTTFSSIQKIHFHLSFTHSHKLHTLLLPKLMILWFGFRQLLESLPPDESDEDTSDECYLNRHTPYFTSLFIYCPLFLE